MTETRKPTIGLSMIVKNEAHVIIRCLDSLKVDDLLDYFYIVDTGSTDGTQEIIRNYFKENYIPGEVVDFPFKEGEADTYVENHGLVDFRNMALAGIKDKVDFVFWIDADEQLEYTIPAEELISDMRKVLPAYDYLNFVCSAKGFQFKNIHLIRASLNWEWHGLIHEYLRVKDDTGNLWSSTIETIKFIYSEEGSSWRDLTGKTDKYIKLLTRQHELEPEAGRWLFYLGQTYRALNTIEGHKKAIEYFDKRVAMFNGGTDAEAYVSKLLSTCLRQELYKMTTREERNGNLSPFGVGTTVGMFMPTVGDFESCAKYSPSRIEHMMHINQILWHHKRYESAYNNSKLAFKQFMKPPVELGVIVSDYTFSCAHIHAINCGYTKRKAEGLKTYQALAEKIQSGESLSLVAPEELARLYDWLNSI